MEVCALNENLYKLRELTPALPNFGEFIKAAYDGFVEMNIKKGNGFGWKLLNEETIAVAKWFCSSGTVLPVHAHNEKKYIIVYEGSMEVCYGEEQCKKLKVGDYLVLEANTPHSACFPEDCWYIAITIPASAAWPK